MNIKIGSGKYDVTGPCARVGFMGMSNIQQRGRGIHTRLYSRAFIVEDLENEKFIAIVCADIGVCTLAMKQAVIKKLKDDGPFDVEGIPLYTEKNVMITGTHTHSGPGGYSHYHVYNASIGGFNEQNFDCIVEGIFKSIVEAHNSKSPGKILIASGDLHNCGKIRSVKAYVKNPEIKENPPDDEENVEPAYNKMTLLKFVSANGKEKGSFNWFALHPTNLGEKNKLISGDNKGYAEQLFEKELDKRGYKDFVSAFANSCCGDVSPNAGKDENGNKYGRPDGKHDLENTEKFGRKQFKKALELYDGASEELEGNIDHCHTYVDMSDCLIDGTNSKTWPAAMGYGMLRGSQEDSTGLGKGFWGEGTTKHNIESNHKWFKKLAKIVAKVFNIKWPLPPDSGYEDGQGAKAIFLPLGYMTRKGVPIAPSILPLQMIKLGSLLLVAHPGELTTVAGMRLRDAVSEILGPEQEVRHVVIATYANAFSSYTTTHEEYEEQHYEGASTLFGPWTFKAFEQENKKLAIALRDGLDASKGPDPEDIPIDKIKELKVGMVIPDSELRSLGLGFGGFDEKPKSSYQKGKTVMFSFVGGYLNRDLKTNGNYFKIEKKKQNGTWEKKFTDDDFYTQLHWHMRGRSSMIRIKWKIPDNQDSGTYRIVYDGPVKTKLGRKTKSVHVEVKFTLE
jgi:neutral ceramidase